MDVQLTTAGQAALDAQQGPVAITSFKVGSAYGYVPDPSQTDIKGTELFSGTPSPSLAVTPNVYLWSAIMDSTVGPFVYGEIGLYMANDELFAIAVSSTPISKSKGDAARADLYVSIIDTRYDLWLTVAESNNPFKIANLGLVDQLPASKNAVPNCYVVDGYQDDAVAFLAYTNRIGWWSFDGYEYQTASGTETNIVSAGPSSVVINNTDFAEYMDPQFPGQVILEVVSGPAYSYCRYVDTVVKGATTTTLNFKTPWAVSPQAGDTVVFFTKQGTAGLPIASKTQLGVVQIGDGLDITGEGVLSVDPSVTNVVKTFNGQTGAVTFEVDPNTGSGSALVLDSGSISNKAKIANLVAGTNVTLTRDGSENVVIASSPGFGIGSGLDINSQTGDLEVDPSTINLPVATTSQFGVVEIGDGIAVAGGVISLKTAGTGAQGQLGGVRVDGTSLVINAATGVVSAGPGIIPIATHSDLGGVIVGQSLTVDDQGTIDYALPQAGTGISGVLGGIKVDGKTLNIDAGSGVVSVDFSPSNLPIASQTSPGIVQVGNGLSVTAQGVLSVSGSVTSFNTHTGDVTFSVGDANTSSGTSLVVDSGSGKSEATLVRLVAGTGVSLPVDQWGNLVINAEGGGFGAALDIAASTTLDSDHYNKPIRILGSTQVTLTFPDSATTAIPAGTAFWFYSQASVASVLQIQGSDTIDLPSGSVSSLTIPPGQTAYVVSKGTQNGITEWDVFGGTVLVKIAYPVTSVDGQTGAVVVKAQDNNTATGLSLIVDSGATTGIMKFLRIAAGTGIGLANDASGNLVINSTAVTGVSSVSGQKGDVIVKAQDNNSTTGQTLIADSGATTGVIKLRTVVPGTGMTISPDANGNLVIASTVSSGVSSVSGQTGAVVVKAQDVSTASGTSLIAQDGSTTAVIQLRRVVAGSGISVNTDGNNNLVVASTAGPQFYDVQAGAAGVLSAGQLLGQVAIVRTVSFPADFANSVAYAGLTATATSVITISQWVSGTSTQIGTVTFAASNPNGTFSSSGSAITLNPGTVLIFSAPATADATLGSVSITLQGTAQ